ncbi:MAG: hypothetical protein ACFFE8_06965 [Candidatus Heimdallarchaeota archaeon]
MPPTTSPRILTHTDMDGVCCAALFLRKYGTDLDVTYASVKQAGDLDKSGSSFDFVCDLPKVGNAINLDHHKSNHDNLVAKNRLSSDDIIDSNSPSATEIVYSHLNLEGDPIASEIRKLGNLADTAQLPSRFRPLDMVLSMYADAPKILREISVLLAQKGDNILLSPWLKQKVSEIRDSFDQTNRIIEKFLMKTPKLAPILILDTRNVIPGKLAKEVIKPIFDLGVAVLAVIYHKSSEEPIRTSLRVTKSKQQDYDVSLTAMAFGGGGHRMAAACSPDEIDIPKNLKNELQKIALPGDTIQYLRLTDV